MPGLPRNITITESKFAMLMKYCISKYMCTK